MKWGDGENVCLLSLCICVVFEVWRVGIGIFNKKNYIYLCFFKIFLCLGYILEWRLLYGYGYFKDIFSSG